ncbi:hypothetical protein Acor_67360 [Acrocarpospora corrugata]|uniref:Transposase DDE domain-containing protein n=1 Tax=Acrocarpospora corrugata TaxID=35763 RepID=A0A5M3WE31_9ACTN|nr:hypothetical protein [Acrocarpospora corrugata]GES04668.1 hypothetical protein Acor_67360 [Acrocarpospora corrugata]
MAAAEPKTLRYRLLHTAVRLVRGQRKRKLKIPETWPWARELAACFLATLAPVIASRATATMSVSARARSSRKRPRKSCLSPPASCTAWSSTPPRTPAPT